jgi:hypothetical protein
MSTYNTKHLVEEEVNMEAAQKAKQELETALSEALKSESQVATPEWWARLREEIHTDVRQRRATVS